MRRTRRACSRTIDVAVVALGLILSGLPAHAEPTDPTLARPGIAIGSADTAGSLPVPPIIQEVQARSAAVTPGPTPSLANTQLVTPPDLGPAKQAAELVGRRTATTKTFATDRPGEFVTELSAAPVHYKAADGQWREIDPTLAPAKDGRLHNKGAAFDLSLAAEANDASVARISVDANHSVAFGLEGAAKVKAATSSDTSTYAGARKDTALRLTSRRSGLKEELVLASPAAPDRFVFPLQLKGMTASIDAGGNVIYRDEAGVERARTPHGYMYDSKVDPRSGEAAASLGVEFSLVPYGKGGTALVVTLDRAWLDDPARQYPVVVDPEYITNTGIDDTYVMKNFTRNNSSDPELKVGTYDGAVHIGRTYLHFNTAPIAGKVIQWGRLDIAESHSWNCGAAGPTPYRVVQGWNGADMTTWPGAAIDVPAGGMLTPAGGACPNRLFTADMNGASANWASGAWNNLGIALVAPNEGDNNYYKKFKSVETGAPPALHVGWTEPATAPSAPQNFVATARNLSAAVSWAPPANNGGAAVDNYVVYAYSYPSGAYANSYAFPPCPTCTSATLTGLTNGQQYYFTVYAHNAVNWGPPAVSNVVVPAPQPPSAPGNPLATPRNLSATVSWTAPTDNGGAAIQFYGVFAYSYPSYTYLSYTQGCATCTSVSVPNLNNGQQYVFGIYAHNGVNWGPGVGTNVVTPAISTPSAPASVIASPGNGSATIAWTAPTDNGGAAITFQYAFAYTTSPSVAYANKYVQVCASCTSGTITGLTNGVSYQFIAFASNSAGNGAYTWSNVVVPGGAPSLLAPTNIMTNPGNGEVTVTWTPPELRLQGLTTYMVRVFPEGATAAVASATVTDPIVTVKVTGLTNGQRYVTTVTASTLLAINVESERSAPFMTAGAPLAPTSAVAFPSDRKAIVTWPETDNNGSTITGYEIAIIDFVTQAQVGVTPAPGSGTEVLGLKNGTQYQFKVRATNAIGTGTYSPSSSPVTPAGRPFAPGTTTASPGDSQATVTWLPPPQQADGTPGDNGRPITSYVVTASPGGQSVTKDGSERSATFGGLSNGTFYVFMVTAHSTLEGSDPSASVTIPAGLPTMPTNVVASPRDGYAVVRWDRASQVGVPVTYTVVASPGGQRATTMATSAVVTGLTNGQPYTFTVQATTTAGSSPVSSPSLGVVPTAAPPPPPPGPQCQVSTLPPPPGEILLESGAVRRRIDVPCLGAAAGRVRIGFFIMDEEVHFIPYVLVTGDGDGRGFDYGMGPEDNRIYIEVDYSTGTGFVESNRSCKNKVEDNCKRAKSLDGAFTSETRADGRVAVEFIIGNSLAEDTPIFGRLKISADLDIVPREDGTACVMGTTSRFPAVEAYHDRGSQTEMLIQENEIDLGAWGLIPMDHGVGGCG